MIASTADTIGLRALTLLRIVVSSEAQQDSHDQPDNAAQTQCSMLLVP